MRELVNLLSEFKFHTDKRKDLLECFREIDHDADGLISKEEVIKYLTSMGEPLEVHELEYLLQVAAPADSSEKPEHVDIVKLSEILMPSDDIIEDLTQQ
eukprot:CAMPEP_0170504530 /NCGR_PEP_ID=MMETSP0208-20121228/48207_1 /TAXON_ID=197538 /ORGANISM="Strombidium inclinatum, Strain S3" /LENGTH=98 /DNA_ID=CAMNT_0010784847 /DNA_START=203 /DNA_END=496 /DNA_ORIENTATION=-